jgi:hypothetical protein
LYRRFAVSDRMLALRGRRSTRVPLLMLLLFQGTLVLSSQFARLFSSTLIDATILHLVQQCLRQSRPGIRTHDPPMRRSSCFPQHVWRKKLSPSQKKCTAMASHHQPCIVNSRVNMHQKRGPSLPSGRATSIVSCSDFTFVHEIIATGLRARADREPSHHGGSHE